MNIRALTFDLDDTLWDNRPVLMAAEHALYDWLGRHYPRIKLHYSLEDMLKLRQNLLQKTPNCNMTSPHCAKPRCASQPKPPVMTTVCGQACHHPDQQAVRSAGKSTWQHTP